ncbi:trichohyalin-like [Tachysurus ichikawai]
MEKRFQADKDRLVLELEEMKEKMTKEKERSKLHQRENESREAQTREEMEALLKERDETRRRFQADKDSLMLQLEEERRNTEKEIERFDKRQITEGCWRKHCKVVEQIILEEETELEKMTKEVNDLKETVDQLKQKARTMDPEMTREGWFLKLCKRKNVKRRRYLEKEIERLELQLRHSTARAARSTEVIDVLLKERVQIKRQLKLEQAIDILDAVARNSSNGRRKSCELIKSKEREVHSTEVTNASVKERKEMKKEQHEEKERNVLKLEQENNNMEKENEINQERIDLEIRAMDEFLEEKMKELRKVEAEKGRV